MKKLSIILIIALMCVCLFGCSGNLNNDVNSGKKGAEAVVVDAIEAVKTFDVDKMCEYLNMEKNEFEGLTGRYMVFVNNTFGKLFYTINSVDETGEDSVAVKATVTAVDIPDLVNKAMGEVMKNADTFSDKTPDEIANILVEKMVEYSAKEDVKTSTEDIEVNVNRKDNRWIPEFDDDDKNALFGNLDYVANLFK